MRNPKLLSLLRQGCTVIFPSGFTLEGDTESNLIVTGCSDKDGDSVHIGYRSLDEEGLEKALQEEEEFSDGDRDDKELALQERKEEME